MFTDDGAACPCIYLKHNLDHPSNIQYNNKAWELHMYFRHLHVAHHNIMYSHLVYPLPNCSRRCHVLCYNRPL